MHAKYRPISLSQQSLVPRLALHPRFSSISSAFATGLSHHANLPAAAAEAYEAAASELLRPPELVLLFSSATRAVADAEAALLAERLFPKAALLGRIDAAVADSDSPPTTIVLAGALPSGSSARSFHVDQPTVPDTLDLEEALRPGAPPTHTLLLATSTFGLTDHLAVLDALFPLGVKVGQAGIHGTSQKTRNAQRHAPRAAFRSLTRNRVSHARLRCRRSHATARRRRGSPRRSGRPSAVLRVSHPRRDHLSWSGQASERTPCDGLAPCPTQQLSPPPLAAVSLPRSCTPLPIKTPSVSRIRVGSPRCLAPLRRRCPLRRPRPREASSPNSLACQPRRCFGS